MTPIPQFLFVLATLSVALLFAAVFLFGSRVHQPGRWDGRRFLSAAAGISVSYVFVHVIPGLSRAREIQTQSAAGFPILFPEYSVYLWTMAGFLGFYGLERMASRRRLGAAEGSREPDVEPWQARLHIGGFTAYAWLLTYLMVWSGKDVLALVLYAVAMGMHLLPVAWNLSHEYRAQYDFRGAFAPALASLAGWACGLAVAIPTPLLTILVALVAGGVIVNAMIGELPKEKDGRYGYFLAGAAAYTALLLTLSHFEKGG